MRIKKRRRSRRPPQTMHFSRALYYKPQITTNDTNRTISENLSPPPIPCTNTKKAPHKAKLYIIRTKKHKNGGNPPFLQFSVFDRPPSTRPDTNPGAPPHSTTKPSKAILEVYFYKLSGTLCYFFNFFQMLVCRFCNVFNIAFQCTGRIWVIFYRFDIRTTIRAL